MRYFALLLMLLSITVCTVGCGEPAADVADPDTSDVGTDTAPDPDAAGDDDDDAAPTAGDDDDDAPVEPDAVPPADGSTE